jgi:uncharacterized Fe-S cluster-containing protein
MLAEITSRLPGFNCGSCKHKNCEDFALSLIEGKAQPDDCPVLLQERFDRNRLAVNEILSKKGVCEEKRIVGVIDQYQADIILDPLPGESSCRETLLPFVDDKLHVGDVVEYRPLGCPIVHYAKIIETNSKLITVHFVGPCKRINADIEYKKIGCCMVIGFEGIFSGKNIRVGETVRFLPNHCMMQKVHSGVVVNIESDKIIIEGIDLKVWHLPVREGAIVNNQ